MSYSKDRRYDGGRVRSCGGLPCKSP